MNIANELITCMGLVFWGILLLILNFIFSFHQNNTKLKLSDLASLNRTLTCIIIIIQSIGLVGMVYFIMYCPDSTLR